MLKEAFMDKRVLKRSLNKGLLTKKDYESSLKTLEDDASRLEVINVEDDELDVDMPTTEDYKD